jgi:hypothetical protein
VTDKSGTIIPQAAVSIVNTETGVQTTTQTNNKGSFTVPGLPGGSYSVTISKQGFRTSVVQNVRVHPALVPTINTALEVGQQVSRLEVTASAVQVETSTGEISNEVSRQQVATLR